MGDTKFVLIESEIEKAAGRVLEKAVGGATDGTMAVAGDLFGGWIGDRVREWRKRNLITQLAKTADFLRAKGVPLEKARALPMGEVYAMFEEASKQDDQDVGEMWAALLANAMDAEMATRVEPAYVAALRTFSGTEARILKLIFEVARQAEDLDRTTKEFGLYIWQHDADKKNAARRTNKIDAARRAYKDNCENLMENFTAELEPSKIKSSLSNLVSSGCIVVNHNRLRFYNLTTSDVIDGNQIELLDSRGVKAAIDALNQALEYSIGASKSLPSLKGERSFDGFSLNYSLTEFGERLVRACECPTKAG